MEATGEGEHFIEFEQYYDDTPPWHSATWDSKFLAKSNERLASTALGNIMEYVVVDGKNAIKYKGPHAEAYLKINQDSKRRYAEFRETEVYKKMRHDTETFEAQIRGGLFTVPDFCSHLFNLEEREKFKNALNVPKICDLFTAAELEMMDRLRTNFKLDHGLECIRMNDDFEQDAARRLRQTNFYKQLNLAALTDEEIARLNQVKLIPWLNTPTKNDLFTVDELNGEYQLPPSFECLRIDNPNREAAYEKYVRYYQEDQRRDREWRNRKTKAVDEKSAPALTTKA